MEERQETHRCRRRERRDLNGCVRGRFGAAYESVSALVTWSAPPRCGNPTSFGGGRGGVQHGVLTVIQQLVSLLFTPRIIKSTWQDVTVESRYIHVLVFDIGELEHISFTVNIPLVWFQTVTYVLPVFFFLNQITWHIPCGELRN